MTLLTLHHPATGEPLAPDTPHSLAGGGDRWPVCAGIPYLRAGRDELRHAALRLLDAGDADGGLAVLLTDQDPFAPLPPPSVDECRSLIADVRAGACGLREAMRRLNFGPVADYFAVRTSTPTFLSGLGLVSQCSYGYPILEAACGIGQFLRAFARANEAAAGLDLVFGKLWLARRFVVGSDVELACADAATGAVGTTRPAALFCHDAFYFFPDKPAAAARFRAFERVLVGHAHAAGRDHGGVAGDLLTAAGYAGLFPGCVLFDDAALTAAHLSGEPAAPVAPEGLTGAEAVSLAWDRGGYDPAGGQADYYRVPAPDVGLVLNPLLAAADGRLVPRWPSPAFAAEYRDADYLRGEPVPPADLLRAAADPGHPWRVEGDTGPDLSPLWAERCRLANRRILVRPEDVL